MKLAIIILHYKDQRLIENCLQSLDGQLTDEIGVLVVNNNPSENLQSLKKKFPRIKVLEAGENLGFAGGNNLGIRKAMEEGARAVILLNNDTLVAKDFIEQMSLKAKNKLVLLSPKIYFASGCEYHHDRYKDKDRGKVIWYAGGKMDWGNVIASHRGVDEVDQGQYEEETETDFATGCAMLVTRDVFDKIGLLDERYFLYYEDMDFCERAKCAGIKVKYSPVTRVWHVNAGSSNVGGGLHDYYLTRNRLLFGLKFSTSKVKLLLIKESLKLLFSGRSWQKKGVRDYFLCKFAKGCYR